MTLTFSPISKWISVRGDFFAFLHAVQDRVHLGVAHRHRAALRAQKSGDAVDRVDQVIALVRHLHMHQHIARHEAALGGHLLAAAHFDHFFGGHQHFVDLVFEACSATDCLICSAIFFSKFERTLTEYHRFAIFDPCLCYRSTRRPFNS